MNATMETDLPSLFEFIRNGMNVKQSKDRNGLPITRIETISNGEVDAQRVGYAGLSKSDSQKWLLRRGDILFSHINSVDHIGKCALFHGGYDLVHGMNLLCLRPRLDRADPSYLKWLFRSEGFRSKIMPFVNKAVNQASISIGNLNSIVVKVPPLDEQKRLAAILDQAEEMRRKRLRAIDRINQLGQAIFTEMFGDPATNPMGWPQAKLSDICEINPRNHSSLVDADSVSFLPMASVSEDGSIIDEKVRPFGEVKKGFTYFERGDVLLAKITPCFENGKATKTDDLIHPVGFGSTEFHVFRPSPRVNADFLFHLLHRKKFRTEGEVNMTGSAGQKRVPASFLKDYVIPLPPSEMQMDFSRRVQEVAVIKLANASSLEFLNKLFSALQHQAFRGELTQSGRHEVAA